MARVHPQRGSKAWGRKVETRAVNLFKTHWPEAHRTGGGRAQQSILAPDVEGVPFFVQVKARHTSYVASLYRKVVAAAQLKGDRRPALVVHQDHRGTPLAVLKLADLLDLIFEKEKR